MTTQNGIIARTNSLTKRFRNITAVKDLNVEIHRGEAFGFLGPNGAGKTTTIGLLLGLLHPTAGSIELFGENIANNIGILKRVGAIVETSAFYPYLSGLDNLRVLATMGGVSVQRIWEVLNIVGMTERAKSKYKTYSLGMKQRLGIAAALLSDPELILLDEPTNGLDPAGMKEVRDLIVRLAQMGKTIFLSSHLLFEVEQVCTRVAIIKKGEVIAQGIVSELLQRGQKLQIGVSDAALAVEMLRGVDWIHNVSLKEDLIFLETSKDNASKISELLAKRNIFLSELKTVDSSLEDFFLEITQGKQNVETR